MCWEYWFPLFLDMYLYVGIFISPSRSLVSKQAKINLWIHGNLIHWQFNSVNMHSGSLVHWSLLASSVSNSRAVEWAIDEWWAQWDIWGFIYQIPTLVSGPVLNRVVTHLRNRMQFWTNGGLLMLDPQKKVVETQLHNGNQRSKVPKSFLVHILEKNMSTKGCEGGRLREM